MKLQLNFLAGLLILCTFLACENSKIEKTSVPDHGKYARIAQMAEDEIEMTRDPVTGSVPKHKLFKVRQELTQSGAYKKLSSDDDWESRGPNDVGGRTRAWFFDSRDTTFNTLFVGSVSGGLWKCTDALSSFPTWERVESYLGNPSIGSMVQDPHNPEIMYIGTGEGWFNGDAYRGDGIYKSIDGGVNWERLESTNNEAFYYNQKMLITQDSVLLVATRTSGLLRSRDGGNSWSVSLNNLNQGFSNRMADVEMTPGGTLFASAGIFSQDGIYRSLDGGEQWDYIELGIDSFERIEISVSKKDSNIVMLMVQDMNTNSVGHLMVSKDNGDTFESKKVPTRDDGSPMARGQAWYDMSSAIDPNNSDIMYAGGVDLFKTIDGGDNWRRVSNWFGGTALPLVHADQHSVQYVGDNSEIAIFSNDGGLFISEDANAIRPSFRDLSQGYVSTQFYACAIHPEEEVDFYVAGSQDNGTDLLTSPGLSSSRAIGGGDGAFCHIDQIDPFIVIRSFQRGNYTISTAPDFGNNVSFSVIQGAYFINPSDYDDEGKILYASSGSSEYDWFNVLTGERDSVEVPFVSSDRMSAFMVDPFDNNILYLGTNNGRILRVIDPTSSEPAIEQLFEGPGFTRNIDIDPSNPNRILCTYSNFNIQSVFYSEDGGINWRSLEGNLPDIPVRWGVFNPGNPEEVIIATEVGIWQGSTSQSSVQWENISGSIGLGRVNMLKYRESDQQMLAASYGKGLYTTNRFAKAGLRFEDSSIDLEIAGTQSDNYCDPSSIENIMVSTPLPFDSDANLTISIDDESTAIEGVDFILENTTGIIPQGELSTSFEILTFDNAILDGDKTLILNLESDQDVLKGRTNIVLKENDQPFNDGSQSVAVQVGFGNIPSPDIFRGSYGNNRTQVLYTAEYLKSNGLSSGVIRKMAFDIREKFSELTYENLRISMGHSDIENLSDLETSISMTEVYAGDFNTLEGSNVIFMQEDFVYDGNSNLIIDFCFDNEDFTGDDFMNSTPVGYDAVISYFADFQDGCIDNGNIEINNFLPNFTFESFPNSNLLENTSTVIQSSIVGEIDAYFQSNDSILCAIRSLDSNSETNCFKTQLFDNGSDVIEIENTFWVQRVLHVEDEGASNGNYELTYFMPQENSEIWQRSHIEALYTSEDLIDTATPEWQSVEILFTEENDNFISFTIPYQGTGFYGIGISDRTVSVEELTKDFVFDKIRFFDILGHEVEVEERNNTNLPAGIYVKSYFNKGALVRSEKIFLN